MSDLPTYTEVSKAVEATARQLVALHQIGDSSFLNLPLLYPGGSSVTLKISPIIGGVRVSDGGFAYREIESIGAESSYPGTAQRVAEEMGIEYGRHVVFVDTNSDGLFGAICDVAAATWRIADSVYRKMADRDEVEIEDHLRVRLAAVFGDHRIKPEHKLKGASSSEWDVSAIVQVNGHSAVFQAVGVHPNSIYKATSAFHDLAALERPPTLVAVVRDKVALGSRIGLLSQVGRVIEDRQGDAVFQRAAS
jgi:hypothetical protein